MSGWYVAILLSTLNIDGQREQLWYHQDDDHFRAKQTCEHDILARGDLHKQAILEQFAVKAPWVVEMLCLTADEIRERNVIMDGTPL